jgi:ubiquinol oxidase
LQIKDDIMNTTAPTLMQTTLLVEGDAPALTLTPLISRDHLPPRNISDRFAAFATYLLRTIPDLCFRQHYMHRAVVLETIAAVPGMVGAVLQHLRALRLFQGRPDMVKLLLDEAENERMHLMTFVALCQPNRAERAMILVAQGVFFNAFFLLYLISPATAHRLVGYFEEEAVISYTSFLQAIDAGEIANCTIPEFARSYWALPETALLRELVVAIRQDEANHRDVNHYLSDVEHHLVPTSHGE